MNSPNVLNRHIKDIETLTIPQVSIDCTVFGFHDNQLKVLLLRWINTNEWCLPGGRIFHHEAVNDAATRILEQRTGLANVFLQQFQTFGESERYKHENLYKILGMEDLVILPDSHLLKRTISIGYYALVNFHEASIKQDEFSEECRWWDIRDVPALLFDHNPMIDLALKTLRRQLNYQPIGYNLLPEKFTMPELQKLYETILGKELDRRNFQKRMLGYEILERLEERKTGGANKSPYLYRFMKEAYDQALENGILFSA